MNGNGWKVAFALFGIIASIAIGWTSGVAADVKKLDAKQTAAGKVRDERLATNEENARTIHYEAQVQRKILESIADAVGAETGPIAPVRPLREVQ